MRCGDEMAGFENLGWKEENKHAHDETGSAGPEAAQLSTKVW